MLFKSLKVILLNNSRLLYRNYSILTPSIEHYAPQCDTTKVLKVGIIGTPNAGKSTLINNLMDRKVCPTSAKVHTTRAKAKAILSNEDSQIIFLDTPGLVNDMERKKYKLDGAFVHDTINVLKEADIVGVVHDVSNSYIRDRLDIKIIKLLANCKDTPSFLVLNKIDTLKSKRKLLDATRLLTNNSIDGKPILQSPPKRNPQKEIDKETRGWPYFKEIFMVSALTGDGLDDIKRFLFNNAKPGEWLFSSEIWTDQTAENIIQNSVQAKLLDFLPQELPYVVKAQIEYFNMSREGVITTVIVIRSPSERISKLTGGTNNGRLKHIIQSVQRDLQDAFQKRVRVNIVLDPPNPEA